MADDTFEEVLNMMLPLTELPVLFPEDVNAEVPPPIELAWAPDPPT
jgi:hypothetical protein